MITILSNPACEPTGSGPGPPGGGDINKAERGGSSLCGPENEEATMWRNAFLNLMNFGVFVFKLFPFLLPDRKITVYYLS